MLLLGVIQAQALGQAAGSYDLLSTTILTSSQASVTFSNLNNFAADYQHLQIRWVARTSRTSDFDEDIILRFNADSGSNYARHWLRGSGSSVTSTAQTSQTGAWSGWATSSTAGANIFGASVIDILHPFSSSKNTTTRTLNGMSPGFGVALISSFWNNTAAVTSISLTPSTGANLVTGSRFSLYGLRKSA